MRTKLRLTIYPDNEKQLREIVALIDGTLDPMNFLTSPRVPGDKPMSERNKISIRYGGLTSPVIVKPEKRMRWFQPIDLMYS